MSYKAYRGVKLLEHAMKIVEKVLERRLRCMVKVDEMQFGFMAAVTARAKIGWVKFKECGELLN